jgi:ABC-type multidrug transport system ATPase subunit/ABC-type multidrug transport system permease subunit
VTSRKDQGQYWYDKNIPYKYIPVQAFVEGFKKFHFGERLAEELATPFDRTKSHPAALVTKKYALTNWEIFKASFAREKLLMKRNRFVYIFKTVQISIVALITMSVFFRTTLHPNTVNDGILYLGAMFFAVLNVLFNGFTDMALTVARLPVFYKQRDMFLYPPWAFVLPAYFLRLPLSVYETFTWVIVTYWTIGFAPEASRFFRQWLVLFAMHQVSLGLFRLVSSVGRIMVLTQSLGASAIVATLSLGGFIVSRANIRGWWIWGYWISPFTYSLNALSVNEFLAPRWNKRPDGFGPPALTLGREILKERGVFQRGYWYWLGVGVLFGYSILFNVMYTFFLGYLDPLGKPSTVISQEAFDEKTKYNSVEDGGGDVQNGSDIETNNNPHVSPRVSIERKSFSSVLQRFSASSTGANSDVSDAIAEAKGVQPKRGMVLPFQPLTIAFHHINYFIDMPAEMKEQGVTEDKLQLLNDISGTFRPGILTALVGVSGAGKTTFMDVLAGRKTGGYIEGSIYISGHPKKQETFARIAGYCEQFDIHSPNVTVHESLLYSAWLRLSKDVNTEVRRAFVEEVMELVELTPLRLSLVGLPGVTGLSTEQRKRLTVAVELVANPSIIFMDEPTSGLDARAAAIVMRTVRNTVDTGRTVVCTIHQPSIDIFEAFDELLLMQRGGRVLYAGPLGHHSQKLIDYFEAVEGVPKIKDGINPSTWMLEVTSQASEQKLDVNFADIYTKSALYQRNEDLINQLSSPAPGVQDISFPTEYAQPFWQQCLACLWKQRRSYWRNPYYNVIRIFLAVLYGCFYGTICLGFGNHRSTEQDVFNMMGALYASTLFLGASNALAVQPVVSVERTVFYRERAAGMYSTFPYSFAQVTVEFPYVFVQAVLFGTILYALIQFEWMAAKFLLFIFFLYFTLLIFTLWGMLTVALTPNLQVAAIISAAAFGIWNLFAGFLIPRPSLPIYWVWYYWLSPTAWTLYGLVTSQLGDVTSPITVKGTYGTHVQGTNETRLPMREFLDTHFGFHHSFLPYVAIWHVGIVLVFGLVFAISIKWINFQRR